MLVLIVLTCLFYQSNSELVHGCSSHCTLTQSPKSLECFDKTLAFFEKSFLGQIKNFIEVEVGIAQWNARNGNQNGWEDIKQGTIDRMMDIAPPDIEDEEGLTDKHTYDVIVNALVDNAKQVFENKPDFEPSIECPQGCERNSDSFFWLFMGSVSVTILLVVGIISMIYLLDYRSVRYSELERETKIPTHRKKKRSAQK